MWLTIDLNVCQLQVLGDNVFILRFGVCQELYILFFIKSSPGYFQWMEYITATYFSLPHSRPFIQI